MAAWLNDVNDATYNGTAVYTPAGTGAVPTTVQSKLRQSVSIFDFLTAAQIADVKAGTLTLDCYSAIIAAIASATYESALVATHDYITAPAIYFPPGSYLCSQTINLKKTVRLYGDGSGSAYVFAANIVFPAGVTGFIINSTGTSYDQSYPVIPYTTNAFGTTIENLMLRGSFGTADAYGGHGIWMRGTAYVKNVAIHNFEGDGIRIVASSGGLGKIEGNANVWRVTDTNITETHGNGLFVQGRDVNAGYAIGVIVTSTTGWGICDDAFLNNTYVGCLAQNGGRATNNVISAASIVPSAVDPASRSTMTITGTITGKLVEGMLLAGTGVTPGTVIETLISSTVATVRPSQTVTSTAITATAGGFAGLGYLGNSRTLFLGSYEEGTLGYPNHIVSPCTWMGGITSAGFTTFSTASIYMPGEPAPYQLWKDLTPSVYGQYQIGLSNRTGVNATGFTQRIDNSENSGAWPLAEHWKVGGWYEDWAATAIPYVERFNSNATVANGYPRNVGGASGAINSAYGSNGGAMGFRRGYFFGTNLNFVYQASAAPTTGNWVVGDIYYNSVPVAGGYIGWVCTTAGSPGTWKTFGPISA